jgi:hypothetical protein
MDSTRSAEGHELLQTPPRGFDGEVGTTNGKCQRKGGVM